MPDITISIQNTINLTVAGGITRLRAPGIVGSTHLINVINYGPGTIWLRCEADPSVGNPQSEMLAANVFDNAVPFQTFVGLIAEADATVVTRFVP